MPSTRWGGIRATAALVCGLHLSCQLMWPPRVQVRNEKAKRFLMNMRRKPGVQLENYFPRADRGAVALLKRMLVRQPCCRVTRLPAGSADCHHGIALLWMSKKCTYILSNQAAASISSRNGLMRSHLCRHLIRQTGRHARRL